MKLEVFMKDLPASKMVRIGTKTGSKFFYIGTVKDCNMGHLNQVLRAKHILTMEKYMYAFRDPKQGQKLHDLVDDFIAYVPPKDREEDHLVIIIEGNESGKEYVGTNKALNPEMIDTDCAYRLVGEVYAGVREELTDAYKFIKNPKITQEQKDRTKDKIRRLEKVIRDDPYGAIGGYEDDIINFCRRGGKKWEE